MAALEHAVNVAFTSGIHVALWVSGLMLLAGAPIAFLTVRYTAPHHVEAREREAAEAEEAAAASLVAPTEGAS
jgi:Na+/H+-translocating membrane pyrophosphatase